MAVLKIKSVPQKYTDELAYQQLLDYPRVVKAMLANMRDELSDALKR